MTIEKINPLAIEAGTRQGGVRGKGMSTSGGFGSMLDAVGAMGPTAMTAGRMYGSPNSSAVLGAAFSGIGASAQQVGGGGGGMSAALSGGFTGGTPYLAAGAGFKADTLGNGGLTNTSAVPGVEGFSQMDMINTMNQNQMQLLGLQAELQGGMQKANAWSNILSADHRARMAMIEKFTARG